MTNTQELARRQPSEVQVQPQEQASEPEIVLRPPVGIHEDAEGITLLIEGTAKIGTPEGMEALYAEVRSTRYRRSFALTAELDADKIDARLKDGVLTIRIPKRAELRPAPPAP